MAIYTIEAFDALNDALACNKGLDALVDLMMATSSSNAPSIECLAELLLSIRRDMQLRLTTLQQCLSS